MDNYSVFNQYFKIQNLLFLMFTLCSLNCVADEQDQIAATMNEKAIPLSLLDEGSELDIYQAEKKLYELRKNNLQKILYSQLIRLDPRSTGLTDEDFVSQYILIKPLVTETELEAFIVENKVSEDKINANLKGQIEKYLGIEKRTLQMDEWFKRESKKYNLKINLVEPIEPRFDVAIAGSPVRGGKDAQVTIVEFSDFQCPYCTKANNTLNDLLELYGEKIKIVYKHFPLSSIHPIATKAAEASICAQQQGINKFWAFHDEIFASTEALSIETIQLMANKLELDINQFNECLVSGTDKVTLDLDQGRILGVTATPAFFINGRFLNGAQHIETFKKIIDQEL